MARLFFKQRLQPYLLSRKGKRAGFTLIELLVAMLVGGLISSALLFLVVQLLQTNLREAARSDTQRDLQSAIDYITRDLREAVYVYDGDCLNTPTDATKCPGLSGSLPVNISEDPNVVPVLAFWRVDRIPQGLETLCRTNASAYSDPRATDLPPAIRGIPCLSGRMYTLIVYSLNWKNSTIWTGRARIDRYELPQYPYNAAAASSVTQGWADPVSSTTSFVIWPRDKSKFAAGQTDVVSGWQRPSNADANNNRVLVDFVDRQGIYGGSAACPTDYVATPKSPASNARGFYVCVRGAANGATLNQEVLVRIQGDAAGRPGIPPGDVTKPQVPITLETRVLTRGVVNKSQ